MSALVITDLQKVEELSSAQMSQVGGGMSCKGAVAAAQVYALTGDILAALGNTTGAAASYGQAKGLIQGACPAA